MGSGLILLWLLFGVGGAVIANSKGESGIIGFLFGLFLGPIGILIVLFMGGRKCPFCMSKIHKDATRCPKCQQKIERISTNRTREVPAQTLEEAERARAYDKLYKKYLPK